VSATTRRLIVLLAVLALFAWVFSDAIFCDRNFSYRDAGHFYYPLMRLVADEWDAGRWPLWNPYENGGMPLLGNPTSAVMYPPRIVLFQWLPMSYGAAFKWYVMSHVLLAAGAAYGMARNWRASEFAAGVAALTYAFGAVVMFQYCNITFLVGAAWVPLGLAATDRMLSLGDWRWSVALGVVLALQVLGGDPESAYVTGVLAALYLAMLDAPLAAGLIVVMVTHGLIALGIGEAVWGWAGLMRSRDRLPTRASDQIVFAVSSVFLVAGAARFLFTRRRVAIGTADRALDWRRRRCLGLAALVVAGLSAVQWIPSWEFGRLSIRTAGELHVEPYAFWVAPWRVVECLWPNVTGHQFPITTRWLSIFQLQERVWEPSLYGGVLPVLMAIFAWRVRGVPHWRRWLSVVLIVTVWASTGPAGGLEWYLRRPSSDTAGQSTAAAPAPAGVGRLRSELENPAGGLYWFLVKTLPGFGTFRYPAKLLTFAAAALAALAAVGWDRFWSDGGKRFEWWLLGLAIAGGLLGLGTLALRGWLTTSFAQSPAARFFEPYGPLQVGRSLWETVRDSAEYFVESRGSVLVPDAFWCIVVALVQSTALMLAAFAVARWSRRHAATVAAAVIEFVFIAFDLGLSNRWLVATSPQSQIDAVPAVAKIIADAEAAEAAEAGVTRPEPFRVHRMSVWGFTGFANTTSWRRHEELHLWEKDTIQPKYGLLASTPAGRLQYTINEGTFELFDYWFFFAPFYRAIPPSVAERFPDPEHRPDRVVYYPRRGFDMWNAKYFVTPHFFIVDDEYRGILSFLPNTTEIAASPQTATDFRVLRNHNYHPRAWIVHRFVFRNPIRDMSRLSRQDPMEEILYQGDEIWNNPMREQTRKDPRVVAWLEVEPDYLTHVSGFHTPYANPSADSARIVHYAPDRIDIEAATESRGLLVLADTLYPGWHATIDGVPQPILRANRLMRALLLEPGSHRVVFTYDPPSFRIGTGLTWVSLALVLAAGIFAYISRSALRPS
jgi:hypothetical protein